jgi:hypothetical protein
MVERSESRGVMTVKVMDRTGVLFAALTDLGFNVELDMRTQDVSAYLFSGDFVGFVCIPLDSGTVFVARLRRESIVMGRGEVTNVYRSNALPDVTSALLWLANVAPAEAQGVLDLSSDRAKSTFDRLRESRDPAPLE